MANISVTDSTSTIVINSGDTIERVMKNKITVSSYKDNVLLYWDGRIQINNVYTDFTAPSGASAIAVADAIEVFLDTGITITATLASEYAEDSAHTSGATGSFILGVVNTDLASRAGNNDYAPISVDARGRIQLADGVAYATQSFAIATSTISFVSAGFRRDALAEVWAGSNNAPVPVNVDDAGRVGTRDNKVEDAAHTTGDIGSFILGVRNDGNAEFTLDNGDYSPISVDSTGRLKVILAANSGVDIGDVDVLSVIPGTGATNLGKAEDAAHTTGDVGAMILGVRNDANAALAGTDLDYIPLATDSAGRIKYAQTVATVTQSITRPADTTAYAAGDIVATATSGGDSTMSFASAVKENDGVGVIIGAVLIDSVNAATKGDFDLWLFDAAPADQNDNVAFAPSDAEAETCLGVIQFIGADARTTSNNAVYEGFLQNPITIVGLSGASNIIGVLVVRNAYTPASAEKFLFRLRIEQY